MHQINLNVVDSRLHIHARRRLQNILATKLSRIKTDLSNIQNHINQVFSESEYKTVANHTEDLERQRELKIERKTIYFTWVKQAFQEFQKRKNLVPRYSQGRDRETK